MEEPATQLARPTQTTQPTQLARPTQAPYSEITYRLATPEDAPLILDFIQQLAIYEHMEDQVVATPELLREEIFERHGAQVLFALIDEDGGATETNGKQGRTATQKEVGFALFFHNFSTFLGKRGIFLEDLFVLPDYRGRGAGRGLIQQLAQIALQRGCGRLEWNCLDWNEPSIKFYKSLGAQPMDEWTTYRLTGDSLQKMANDGEQ